MKTLTKNEAEAYFLAGGEVVRTTAAMPKTFETPIGLITRQTVNDLYREGKVEAVRLGRDATAYRKVA